MSTATDTNLLNLKAKLFNGFADPSRLAILQALIEGPRSVGEIVKVTGLSQPNTSNHLNCLRDCGLVERQQRGRFVYYRLSDERPAVLLELAGEVLAETARGVYECTHYKVPVDDEL